MSNKFIIFQSHPIQYYAPLYTHLSNRGIDLKVYYGSKHGLGTTLDKEFNARFKWDVDLLQGYSFSFLRNAALKPGPYGFWNILNLGILKEIISKEKKTFMVYGWNYATNILIILVASFLGHHVTFKAETPLVHELQRSGWKLRLSRLIIKQLLKMVDSIQYIGKQNKLFYKSLDVPEYKMIFTPYSVDNQRFLAEASKLVPKKSQLRDKLDIPKEKKVFILSGKFIAKKRPLDLLEAIGNLSEVERDKSYFIFMGEGALREDMERFIFTHKLENVKLTGFINQSLVSEYYALSDVFIMCSGVGETWGLSTNEALCFGLPVILSDLVGSAYDLVENNGLVFKTGNIDELTNCLVKMINLEKEELEKLGYKSQEIVKRYSYDVISQNMFQYFKNI